MIRNRVALVGAVLMAGSVLAGCTHASAAGTRAATVAALNSALSEGYTVAAGDKLRVTVFDEASLTGEYTIGVGGDLALPLIESIPASGQTTAALSQTIAGLLKQGGYVLNPRVSVEVLQHRPFYILGEVKLPGEYPYAGDLTLEQAVAKAGGYTARANRSTVLVKRQQSPNPVRVQLDGTPLRIAPGDTITIREAFF